MTPGGEVGVDASGLRADLTSVEAIARLALAARRSDARLRVVGASPELLELLELCGVPVAPLEGRV